jgi:hypothetical protein
MGFRMMGCWINGSSLQRMYGKIDNILFKNHYSTIPSFPDCGNNSGDKNEYKPNL